MTEHNGGLDYLPETALSRSDLSGLERFVPPGFRNLENPQSDLPRIAKDKKAMQAIEASVQEVPTTHSIHLGDARRIQNLTAESIHLVLTSPPYWTLNAPR